MSSQKSLIECAEEMLELAMVAYAEGHARLGIVNVSERPKAVLYVDDTPALEIVFEPGNYPPPPTASLQ